MYPVVSSCVSYFDVLYGTVLHFTALRDLPDADMRSLLI